MTHFLKDIKKGRCRSLVALSLAHLGQLHAERSWNKDVGLCTRDCRHALSVLTCEDISRHLKID